MAASKGMLITARGEPGDLYIFINGILHIHINKKKYGGLQAWYINDGDYKIEILTRAGKLLIEYNSRSKWEKVLELIYKNL